MRTSIKVLLTALAAATGLGCGGGIKASRGADAGGGAGQGNAKDVHLAVQMKLSGAIGLALQASPVVEIFAQRLNFTMDCTAGGGSATESFMAVGTDSDDATFTANFTTTVPSYCDDSSATIVSLVGKFGNATTGMTFTLNAAAAATTYRSGAWSVHASLTYDAGPPAEWTALFEFDKATTGDTANDSLVARETVNGTITVEVNDRCAGAASISANGTSTTSFVVEVPHTLTTPVQWTEVLQDTTLAVSPYTEDGANVGGTHGQWTFDFASATVTDANVQYRLTVAGAGNMLCIATVTFAVTATDGVPTTIP